MYILSLSGLLAVLLLFLQDMKMENAMTNTAGENSVFNFIRRVLLVIV